tara:strand:- start:224 stop:475 length:252 start_codon:yes stop_codon:yes gene_type:complete
MDLKKIAVDTWFNESSSYEPTVADLRRLQEMKKNNPKELRSMVRKTKLFNTVEFLSGVYFFLVGMNWLSNKLVNKNNYTWHKK